MRLENADALSYDGLLDGYAPPEKGDPPPDLEELSQTFSKWFDDAQNARQSYEFDWELYRLYIKGDQLVARNRDTGEVVRLSVQDSKRFRSMNNQLRPTSRSLVAKLSEQIPTCKVLPATSDVAEQHGARVGTAILEYFRRKENLDVLYLKLNEYLPAFGNSFVCPYWDPSAGRKIAVCQSCNYYDLNEKAVGSVCPQCQAQRQDELAIQQNEQEAMDAEHLAQMLPMLPPGVEPSPDLLPPDRPQAELQQLGPLPVDSEPPPLVEAHEGDVRAKVYDPRDVFVPRGIDDIAAAEIFATRDLMSVPAARRRFTESAEFIQADKGLHNDREAAARYGSWGGAYNIVTDYLNDHCWVFTVHERPSEMYPKGRLFYVINKVVVEYHEESPYDCLNRVPAFHFGFDYNPGEFWREPFVAQAWHRQRELNHVETHIREHVEQLVKPNLVVPQGAELSIDDFDFGSFKVLKYYKAAGDPFFQNPPPVPQGLFQRKAELSADIRMMAAVTDQELGAEASDPNGRAMAIVNAEADRQVGPITKRNNAEWREFHKAVLQLYQKFAHPERVATIVGPEGMMTLSFGDLNLQPGWDVDIEEMDGLSRNPSIRFNEVMQLFQATQGMYFVNPQTNMPDMGKLGRMAKLNNVDDGYDEAATEVATAAAIPYLLMKGQPWQPKIYDDPAIFEKELRGWLRGPGRKTAPPELTMQVEQVWQFYAQWKMTGAPGMMPATGGQASPAGAGGQSAPGGTPNNPGMLGSDLANGGIEAQAQQQVSDADQTGEDLARQGLQREG